MSEEVGHPRSTEPSPGSGRPWLGFSVFLATVVIIASPRSAAVLAPAVLAVGAALAIHSGTWRSIDWKVSVALAGFTLWAGLSTLWSPEPLVTIEKSALLALLAGLGLLAGSPRDAPDHRNGLGGLLLALGLGAAFVAFEVLTGQALTRGVATLFGIGPSKHISAAGGLVTSITESEINRRTAAIVLFMIPAFLAAALLKFSWARLAAAAFGALLVVLLVASWHQSSQAALLAGATTFALARMSCSGARMALAAAWCAACLLVVPAVRYVDDAGWGASPALPHSARHRIVVWDILAQDVGDRFWTGYGAGATPHVNATRFDALAERQRASGFDPITIRHAHNVYLEVWIELGAVGAVLLTILGLSVLAMIAALPVMAQPFVLAQFSIVATMVAFSYSLWQPWFQSLLILSGIVALRLARRLGSV